MRLLRFGKSCPDRGDVICTLNLESWVVQSALLLLHRLITKPPFTEKLEPIILLSSPISRKRNDDFFPSFFPHSFLKWPISLSLFVCGEAQTMEHSMLLLALLWFSEKFTLWQNLWNKSCRSWWENKLLDFSEVCNPYFVPKIVKGIDNFSFFLSIWPPKWPQILIWCFPHRPQKAVDFYDLLVYIAKKTSKVSLMPPWIAVTFYCSEDSYMILLVISSVQCAGLPKKVCWVAVKTPIFFCFVDSSSIGSNIAQSLLKTIFDPQSLYNKNAINFMVLSSQAKKFASL